MTVRVLIQLALILGVCVSAGKGCGDKKPKSFVTGVRSADAATLYEGLPHQMFERKALEQEIASKATVRLHKFPFYQEPLVLSEKDERALREIALAGDTFAAFSAEKKCGGFHPDYCVGWRGSDGSAYRMLVCFGCHETKLCGPGEEVRYDVREEAYARMKAILTPYRKNRPETR